MMDPRNLEVLIIEDDKNAIANYSVRFTLLGLPPPNVVTSFNEASSTLNSVKSIDLVILDLCIPGEPGLPPPEVIDYGLVLLKQCIERDEHPIPSLIIITGHLEKTEQSAEREKLEREFACGKLVSKSPDRMNSEIDPVIERICVFKQKRISGEHIITREKYLVRRLALELDYQGFQLSLPTAQPANLQVSPFSKDDTKLFIGKPILQSGAESSHCYYLAFITGDRDRLDATFVQAKQWAETCPHIGIPKRIQSNTTALLYFPLTHAGRSGVGRGAKRTKVCDLVFACMPDGASITALIRDLAQYDPAYRDLDEGFVRDVLEQSNSRWAKVAALTMRVGAFGEKAGTEGDSKRRRRVAKTFEQNHGNHTCRRG